MDGERAVANLIAAYAEAMDGGDFDAVADLLADAVVGQVGSDDGLRGRAAVLALYERTTRRYEDGTPRTRHLMTNLWLEVDEGTGTARARSYYTVLQQTDRLPLQPIISGGYHDRFERRDGRWRFTERRFTTDLIGDLSQHLAEGSIPDRS